MADLAGLKNINTARSMLYPIKKKIVQLNYGSYTGGQTTTPKKRAAAAVAANDGDDDAGPTPSKKARRSRAKKDDTPTDDASDAVPETSYAPVSVKKEPKVKVKGEQDE